LILLGEKETHEPYNDEDLSVLRIVSAQAAITIENALLYQEVKDFNVKLKKEVAKATRELRQANRELKKLDEAKSEFISIASHQLRTPLTVIKGYGSMLLEGNFGQLSIAATEAVKKIYTSNERLIRLVENLLNISRIEAGRLEYEFKPINLEQIIKSVCEELETTAQAKKIKLDLEIGQNLPPVMADEEKIRQVVLNLIDNAIKYSQGKPVKIKLEKRNDKIQFCVTDQGLGIDPADMPHLFKKFVRGKKTALVHTEGTGLGLYVAHKIITGHKGRIWAQSPGLGQGSTFCFWLPVGRKS
jgi:signal transduction histidine kinase